MHIFTLGVVKHKIVASAIGRFKMLRSCKVVYFRTVCACAVYKALTLEVAY